jgi:hypothetical protein
MSSEENLPTVSAPHVQGEFVPLAEASMRPSPGRGGAFKRAASRLAPGLRVMCRATPR